MSRSLWLFTPFLLLSLPASAEIYADFSVSHGETSLGTFRVRLDFEKAPRTCANFIGLATGDRPWIDPSDGTIKQNTPYYDGIIFHRLDHDFVIQGGDPSGTGSDGPGFGILDEFHPDLRHSGRYMLSMAKTPPPNTGGSQFFITFENAEFLDDKHAVFGEVITGKEIIDNFTDSSLFPTNSSDRPLTPIVMNSVSIGGSSLESFSIDDPNLSLPHLRILPAPMRALSYSTSESTFSVALPRDTRCEYLLFDSTDFKTWAPLSRLTSVDQDSSFWFTVPNRTSDRYFLKFAVVDYQDIPSAKQDLTSSGSQLTVVDPTSESEVALSFDGSGSGTWTDTLGNSGSLSEATWRTSVPTTGSNFDSTGFANDFSTGSFSVTFDAPAGSSEWISLNDVFLSFHRADGGWVTGTATSSSGSVALRHSFSCSP